MKNLPNQLKQILEVAVTAPSNLERFQKAGLVERKSYLSQPRLVDNWREAFVNLMPINKQVIRQKPSLFLANVDDIVYRGMTSGTTGQSFTYFAGTEWDKKRLDVRRRSLEWWGITAQTPIINVASRLFPVREQDISLVGSVDQEFLQLLLSLMGECLSVIRGYPSRLSEIATHLYGKKLAPIRAVLCTGECLFDYQKKLLEDVFNAPIINEYGCQETGISGFTCPEAGLLHLDSDRCFYESLEGELVTTDLFNYTMPLVRYQCGDLIELYDVPCPCGRPGLTGKILGRIENKIRTNKGVQLGGTIIMPPLENILNYRVLRLREKINIWVQSVQGDELSFNSLNAWIKKTFGNVSSEIFLNNIQPIESSSNVMVAPHVWIESITQKSWSLWLQSACIPSGYANLPARLLQALINPRIIINSGLTTTTQKQLDELISLYPCSDIEIEIMTARVLLFSCSFLANSPDVNLLYYQAVDRLKNALTQLSKNFNYNAARLDLLIPALYLDAETARSTWAENSEFALSHLDTFNVHHLLVAFETACQKLRFSPSKSSFSFVKPLLSLLIGDLNFFASSYGTWLLAHWCQIFQGNLINLSLLTPLQNYFISAWIKWRCHLINREQNIEAALSELMEAAITPEEKARAILEKAYGKIVQQQQLNPQEWLPIINQNASLLTQGLSSNEVDIIPWIPILRALVVPLFEQGERDLAYQCLLMSTLSSSRYSAFERLARLNDKQLVIFSQE